MIKSLVINLHLNSPDILSKLVTILGDILASSEVCLNITSLYEDYTQCSYNGHSDKDKEQKDGNQIFRLCLKCLSSASLLIRLSAVLLSNDSSIKTKSCMISAEQIDIAVSYIRLFIIDNHCLFDRHSIDTFQGDQNITDKENQVPNQSKKKCVEDDKEMNKMFELIVSIFKYCFCINIIDNLY